MTVALSLFFYILTVFFVIFFQPFGALDLQMPTVTGAILYLFFGLVLLFIKGERWNVSIARRNRIVVISTVLSCIITAWLIYIVYKHGYSAFLYHFQGKTAPDSVLYGKYRDALPLRALLPPVTTALIVSAFLFRIRTVGGVLSFMLVSFITILFVGIYETRHVVLWLLLYIFYYNYAFINSLKAFLNLKHIVKFGLVFATIFTLFTVFGNIRSRLHSGDSLLFARGMAVSERFENMPMPLLWGLIYANSGVARGIVNDSAIVYFNLDLPKKMFPGFIQDNVPEPTTMLNSRFTDQKFIIDAWHTYCLNFGFFGGIIVTTIIFSLFISLSLYLKQRLSEGKIIPGWYFVIFLWFTVRISLLTISDYFLDLAAVIELIALISIFQIVGFKLVPLKGKTPDLN